MKIWHMLGFWVVFLVALMVILAIDTERRIPEGGLIGIGVVAGIGFLLLMQKRRVRP